MLYFLIFWRDGDAEIGTTARIRVHFAPDSTSKLPCNSRNGSRIPASPIPAPQPVRLN
jgi:hypothetical protein